MGRVLKAHPNGTQKKNPKKNDILKYPHIKRKDPELPSKIYRYKFQIPKINFRKKKT